MKASTRSSLLSFFYKDKMYAGYLAQFKNYFQKINGRLSLWVPNSFKTIFIVKLLLFIFISLFILPVVRAQSPNNGQKSETMTAETLPPLLKGKGKITGIILDESGKKPVAFATIILVDKSTGQMINGTISEETGKFFISRIATGQYQLSATFMGYETHVIPNLVIRKGIVNIGTIALKAIPEDVGEVAILGEKTLLDDKVDQIMYNTGNDKTTPEAHPAKY